MAKSEDHVVCVRICTHDRQSTSEARARVHKWLEHFGHTASSFGFDFEYTIAATSNKPIEFRRQG